MLWILLGIFVSICVIGVVIDEDVLSCAGFIIGGVILAITLIILGGYNNTKTTADKKISVLEKRNEEVVKQIEPLVKQYLDYEISTYKELKPNADKLIALSQYPELKGNEFIQTQIQVILENQKKITELNLEKAELNSYKCRYKTIKSDRQLSKRERKALKEILC